MALRYYICKKLFWEHEQYGSGRNYFINGRLSVHTQVVIYLSDLQIKELEKDVKNSSWSAFAVGTKRNLMTQWRTFLLFCAYFKFVAIPASLKTVCFYIQFLSRSFKSVESIKNYISGIHTLHLFLDESFPYFDEFVVKLLFRGIERNTQHSSKRALAITIDILLDIYKVIDHNDPKQSNIWCLSNLVPDTKSSFDRNKQMTRNKVVLEDGIAIVIFSWSKTIQMGDRILKINLLENKGSKLCPVTAYMNMCSGRRK